jgi:hypothetical protein
MEEQKIGYKPGYKPLIYTDTTQAYRDIRKRSKESLYYFAKVVCGMTDVVDRLHMPFANYLQLFPWNGGPPQSGRKLAWMPREHFKSTFASICLPIWLLIHDPNATICIISAKIEHPQKWLRQIKYIIRHNPIFRIVFPEIQPDFTKWDETEILIQRSTSLSGDAQASVTAASIVAGQASQHFDHMILDDPVNEKVAKSEALMQQARDFYIHLESLLREWETSTFTTVGTPWGREDVIEYAMSHEVASGDRLFWGIGARGDFNCSEVIRKDYPECVPTLELGKPIFPERCPEAKLKMLEMQDVEKFYLQYLCKPYDEGRNGFDLDLIRDFAFHADGNLRCGCDEHQHHNHHISKMSVIAISDPAVSKEKKNCETGFGIYAKADCGCRFVIHETGWNLEPNEVVDEYARALSKGEHMPWCKTFGIEKEAMGKVYRSWLEELQSRGEFPLGIKLVDIATENRSKDVRMKGQIVPVRNGLWHKRPTMRRVDGKNNLMDQIAKWPYGKHRDRADTWAYCDSVWEEAPAPAAVNEPGSHDLVEANYAIERRDERLIELNEE